MRRKTIVICVLTVLLCLVSGFLPEIVLGLQDRALAARSESVSVDEVQLSLLTQMGPVEKLKAAGDASATSIYLSTGRNLTQAQALENAWDLAFSSGLLTHDQEEYETSLTPELRMTSDGAGLLLWRVRFLSDALDLEMLLDDETGWCLGYRQYMYLLGKEAWEESQAETGTVDEDGAGEIGATPDSEAGDVWVKDSKGKVTSVNRDNYYYFYEYFEYFSSLRGGAGAGPEIFYYSASRLLEPMGLTWDQTYAESPDTVMVYVPDKEEYFLLPVTVRGEGDGYEYPLRVTVSVNMG